MVTVAAVQLRVDDAEAVPDRLARASELVLGLSPVPDLVVMPELWGVGAFNLERIERHAEPFAGSFVERMAQVAHRLGVTLHAGSFPERSDEGITNTSVVFGPDGHLLARYRKIHLFGFEGGEAALLAAGRDLVRLRTPLGATGLATCYDLRFPEQFRLLTRRDVHAFLIPSGWPAARIEHWSLLSRARALENLAFLVGANAVGTNGGVAQGGRSVLVGPWGQVVAEASGTEEEVLIGELDPADVLSVRATFPVLTDRRLD